MSNKKNNFKLAFTLSEVLITLGIIGVVAAMTIPNLIADARNKRMYMEIVIN
jgi:prepilin-type N-terminal cleavage/methylation domain-containing protein